MRNRGAWAGPRSRAAAAAPPSTGRRAAGPRSAGWPGVLLLSWRDAGGQGGRGVDHQDVAGPEQIGQVGEVPVLAGGCRRSRRGPPATAHRLVGVREPQAGRTPRAAAGGGTADAGRRLRRLERRGLPERAGSGPAEAGSRAAGAGLTARSRPAAGSAGTGFGQADPTRRPVRLDEGHERRDDGAGRGRSEMSSPGKASWCIRVRRSPGSTDHTCQAGSRPPARRSGGRGLPWRRRSPPARVGLDGRVGGDVDHPWAGAACRQCAAAAWVRANGATTLASRR